MHHNLSFSYCFVQEPVCYSKTVMTHEMNNAYSLSLSLSERHAHHHLAPCVFLCKYNHHSYMYVCVCVCVYSSSIIIIIAKALCVVRPKVMNSLVSIAAEPRLNI